MARRFVPSSYHPKEQILSPSDRDGEVAVMGVDHSLLPFSAGDVALLEGLRVDSPGAYSAVFWPDGRGSASGSEGRRMGARTIH